MIKRFTSWAGSDGAVSLLLNVTLLFMLVYALAASVQWHDLAK